MSSLKEKLKELRDTVFETKETVDGIVEAGIVTQETDPTVPAHVKAITQADITNWNQGGSSSQTVTAGGADLAEVGTWHDGNPSKENRLYRFVTISGNEREISIANDTSQIVGTSNLKSNVGFLGNYHTGDELDTSKVIVSLLGVVPVKTNDSTIKENDRVVSDTNGYAVKSTNNCGYRVLDVLGTGLLSIVVSPNTDMIQRIKTDMSKVENKLPTDAEKQLWNNKSDFSGNYNDLANKPNIPTKTSQLTNDSGYVTSSYHDDTKVDKVDGKGLSTNDYTDSDKTKLEGIEEGANNYTLPVSSNKTLGGVKTKMTLSIANEQGQITGLSDEALKALGYTYVATNNDYLVSYYPLPVEDDGEYGLMSFEDKDKLDGIEEGANKYVLPSDVVQDSSYQHTDNNYDNTSKAKVDSIPSNPKYTDTVYDDTEIKSEIESLNEDLTNLNENKADKNHNHDGVYLKEHQALKTINNQSIIGQGNITIEGGSGTSESVKYTPQTLSDSQKQQARENQGIVTITQEEYDLIDSPNEATIYLATQNEKISNIYLGGQVYSSDKEYIDCTYTVTEEDVTNKYVCLPTSKSARDFMFSFKNKNETTGTVSVGFDNRNITRNGVIVWTGLKADASMIGELHIKGLWAISYLRFPSGTYGTAQYNHTKYNPNYSGASLLRFDNEYLCIMGCNFNVGDVINYAYK